MTVQELEQKLREAKAEQDKEDWNKVTKRYKRLGEILTGKQILTWGSASSWAITNVTKFHQSYHVQGSGAYGQWDKRRYLCLEGEQFGVRLNDNEDAWTTSGKVDFSRKIENMGRVNIQGEVSIGVPLLKGQSFQNVWNRFAVFGVLEHRTIVLSISEEAYENNNHQQAQRNLNDFLSFTKYAPAGVWDIVKDHYHKQLHLAHDLHNKLGKSKDFKVEDIKL